MQNTRELLLEATKELLWERGYDAMSPNDIIQRSGVGKGSFYHHFKGKKALAIAALELRADELVEEFEGIFSTNEHWLDQLDKYFSIKRYALKGCRMGRVILDPSFEDPELLAPAKRYFSYILKRFQSILAEAQQKGELPLELDPLDMASTIMSVLQGIYMVSRATQNDFMIPTTQNFLKLLRMACQK